MPDEFHSDETLLTFYGTQSFSLHAMPAKLMIFNAMKSSMKLPLRLVLCAFIEEAFVTILSTPCIWNLICQTAKLTKIGDVIVCTKVLVVPSNRHLVWCIVNLKFGDEFRSVPKTNGRFVLVSDEPSFSSKKLQALGWKSNTLEETLKDSVESFRKAGVLD